MFETQFRSESTRPRTGLRISEIDLCAWLGQAAPQDAVEYPRGFLVLDVNADISRLQA